MTPEEERAYAADHCPVCSLLLSKDQELPDNRGLTTIQARPHGHKIEVCFVSGSDTDEAAVHQILEDSDRILRHHRHIRAVILAHEAAKPCLALAPLIGPPP